MRSVDMAFRAAKESYRQLSLGWFRRIPASLHLLFESFRKRPKVPRMFTSGVRSPRSRSQYPISHVPCGDSLFHCFSFSFSSSATIAQSIQLPIPEVPRRVRPGPSSIPQSLALPSFPSLAPRNNKTHGENEVQLNHVKKHGYKIHWQSNEKVRRYINTWGKTELKKTMEYGKQGGQTFDGAHEYWERDTRQSRNQSVAQPNLSVKRQ